MLETWYLWEQAAAKAEIVEKDGFWCARWSEPSMDITGYMRLARVPLLRLGPIVGPEAITREKAESVANATVFRDLRSRAVRPLTTAELRRQVERLVELDAADETWPDIMRDLLKLPLPMLEAVQSALRPRRWIQAHDPLDTLRKQAINRFRRGEGVRAKTATQASGSGKDDNRGDGGMKHA